MTIETTHILLKRGNTSQSLTYTGPLGEVTVDTDLHSLRVHDGVTPGGNLVSSGTGPANTGNWSFLNNTIHNLAGGQISNGDQSHGYTAGILLPVNGAAAAIVLNNTYGNVILQSGLNANVTAAWTFGSDGKLTLPGTRGSISSEIGTDLVIANQGTGATLSWADGAFVPNTTPISSITVSDLGATIDVTTDGWNTSKTWTFGADGALTFPDSATLAVGSGAEIDALTLIYIDYRDQLDLVFAAANYTGDGYPADFTSYNRLTASADPAIQSFWIPLAKAASDAYDAMLTAQQAISFNIDLYGRQWTFTSDRSNLLNSLLIPENTTISGPDSIELRADGDANKKALINLDAANNRVSILTTNLGWVFSNNGILSLPPVGKIGNGPANWTFSEGGTLTVPSPQSNPFILTFAETNYFGTVPKPTLALTSAPWTVEGQYVYAANGESQLTLGAIGPNLVNPGYAVGDVFTFEVYGADQLVNHGIVGYTLTIEIITITEGPSGFTAGVTESPAPEYPSTILTDGAIKLTTNVDTSWTFGADGALTLPSGYPILFGNGNSRIQAGMGFHINSEEGISLEAVDATDPLLPVVHQWHFGTDGALNSPGGSFTKTTNNYLANNVTTQVVWTSTQNGISGVKLTIQVECDETGGVNYPNWETQVCEAIIAVRGYNSVSEPVMSVYGVTHTSVEPLMTFSVQRNPTTYLIEMVGTRTATASPLGGADLRIYSVETGTND